MGGPYVCITIPTGRVLATYDPLHSVKSVLLTNSPDGVASRLDGLHDCLVEERHQLLLAHALKWEMKIH